MHARLRNFHPFTDSQWGDFWQHRQTIYRMLLLKSPTQKWHMYSFYRFNQFNCKYNFKKSVLKYRSNAFTRPRSFLLLRQLMRTWVLFLTDCVRTESGPVLNSSCSFWANSSGVISLFGFWASDLEIEKESKHQIVISIKESIPNKIHEWCWKQSWWLYSKL